MVADMAMNRVLEIYDAMSDWARNWCGVFGAHILWEEGNFEDWVIKFCQQAVDDFSKRTDHHFDCPEDIEAINEVKHSMEALLLIPEAERIEEAKVWREETYRRRDSRS
jgi:hypothetical protein